MGYVEQSLTHDEQVIVKARLHWGMFVMPAAILLIGILLIGNSKDGSGITCVWWLILLWGLFSAIDRVITYLTTEFALTNKRLMGKIGLLRRRSLELMLNEVESISVDEPLLGRILGYATITVAGTGGTKQSFSFIAGAMGLRREIVSRLPSK